MRQSVTKTGLFRSPGTGCHPFATIREVLRLVCRLRSEPVERAEFADRFLVLRNGEVREVDSLSDAG